VDPVLPRKASTGCAAPSSAAAFCRAQVPFADCVDNRLAEEAVAAG
jgi:hypothetical protein